jgi:hypothetical protein
MKIITNALQLQYSLARYLTPKLIGNETLALSIILFDIGAVGIFALQFIK